MEANILPRDPYQTPPPLTLGLGSVGQTLTFSKHGHVAYPIKGNHQMQQYGSKYFASRPIFDPLTLLLGSKIQN